MWEIFRLSDQTLFFKKKKKKELNAANTVRTTFTILSLGTVLLKSVLVHKRKAT